MIIRRSIQSTLVVWRLERPFKLQRPGSILTPPLAAAEMTVTPENWTDPFRQMLCSRNWEYIYAIPVRRESTQTEVRCDVFGMVHIADSLSLLRSCLHHLQHLKNRVTVRYIQVSIHSTMMYSLKYSITIALITNGIGTSSVGGASSPMFVEDGDPAYMIHLPS
jgi:hypothetical protein